MSQSPAVPSNRFKSDIDAISALMASRQAVLATQSASIVGFPIITVVPVGLTPDGDVITLLSELAQHTRNLNLDNRMSMLLHDDIEQNWQAAARLSVLGHLEPVDPALVDFAALRQSFFRTHPELTDFDLDLDFKFWQVLPVRYRFIAGFGKIHWLDHIAVELLEDDWSAEQNHLNAGLQKNSDFAEADVLQLSRYGAQILQHERVHFLIFNKPIDDAAGALSQLQAGQFTDAAIKNKAPKSL